MDWGGRCTMAALAIDAARWALLALALLLALCLPGGHALAQGSTPFRPDESVAERDTVASVHLALQYKDCSRAVSHLNGGLRARYTGIYLLAGAMYENGLCLKADWDRAQGLYQRAQEAGHSGGGYRLVAGAAVNPPGAGPRDVGLALWWGQEVLGAGLPEPCRVPAFVHKDAEAYVLTLQRWPPERLAHCVYSAGVMAAAIADLAFPSAAVELQLTGEIEMRFLPARGEIEWKTLSLDVADSIGLRGQEAAERRLTRKGRETFESYMRDLGERALKRYIRPAGIPDNWVMTSSFAFSFR